MQSPVSHRGFVVAELLIAVAVLGLFATTILLALQWHYQFVLQRPLTTAVGDPIEVGWQQRLLRQSRAIQILQGAKNEI